MFSGLPVLLSDAVIGRLEMIDPGNSGYLFPCGNADAMATLLRGILGNSALLQHMKQCVARQVDRWTSEDLLDSWVSAIETSLRSPKRGVGKKKL